MKTTTRRLLFSVLGVLGLGVTVLGVVSVSGAEEAKRVEREPREPRTDIGVEQSKEAWGTVYEVLVSPRCMNCHPVGDAPLQTDQSIPHAMNISRQSQANGLECATCHQPFNTEVYGAPGEAGPPGAPHWQLPPKDMPMVFQDRTPTELCEQLKRPADNGNKTLEELVEHVTFDALVLWGWNPGGERTKPPHSHEDFVEAFEIWVDGGAHCP